MAPGPKRASRESCIPKGRNAVRRPCGMSTSPGVSPQLLRQQVIGNQPPSDFGDRVTHHSLTVAGPGQALPRRETRQDTSAGLGAAHLVRSPPPRLCGTRNGLSFPSGRIDMGKGSQTRTVHRSSITGRRIKPSTAQRHPKTSIGERVRTGEKSK